MGDIADYILESIEYGYSDDCRDGWEESIGLGVICRNCGRKWLHWEDRFGKWKLCDDRGIHKCSSFKKPIDE